MKDSFFSELEENHKWEKNDYRLIWRGYEIRIILHNYILNWMFGWFDKRPYVIAIVMHTLLGCSFPIGTPVCMYPLWSWNIILTKEKFVSTLIMKFLPSRYVYYSLFYSVTLSLSRITISCWVNSFTRKTHFFAWRSEWGVIRYISLEKCLKLIIGFLMFVLPLLFWCLL